MEKEPQEGQPLEGDERTVTGVVEEGKTQEVVDEEEVSPDQNTPPEKRLREEDSMEEDAGGGHNVRDYNKMTLSDLKEELKRRKFKVRGMTEEEMRSLLRREDKTQGRLNWGGQGTGQGQMPRERVGEMGEEEERVREAGTSPALDREDEWEDINPMEGDSIARSETTKVDRPNDRAMGRPRSAMFPGRSRGRGQRGFWVKREAKLRGRTKSNEGGSLGQTNDPKANRVKDHMEGVEPR